MPYRILIADDSDAIRDVLNEALQDEGYDVTEVASGDAVIEAFKETNGAAPDLALMDIRMPGKDGLEVLRTLRSARDSELPIIVMTAFGSASTAIEAMKLGAFDYIAKPFELDELNARMRAVLRRHAGRGEPLLVHGALTLDPATRQVTLGGAPVALSAREFAVLEALLQRPGAILSRAQLEDRLYGWGEEIESNAVSVYIHQLRRKLGADTIRNVRGVGYYIGEPK